MAEAHVRLPVRILLAFTPLRPLALPKEGLVPVAQNVDLRNVVLRTPQARGVLQHETIDVLRADAAWRPKLWPLPKSWMRPISSTAWGRTTSAPFHNGRNSRQRRPDPHDHRYSGAATLAGRKYGRI